MGEEGDLVAPRLARGCRCFVVRLGGVIAGYAWLSTSTEWIGEIQLEITPGPGEGYIWNCVTIPQHRRKGIFGALLLGIADTALREGLKRLWIGTIAIPAEKALAPSGFRPALRFNHLRIAGMHSMQITVAGSPLLVAAASEVLGVKPGRQALSRIVRRRH